jgi:hypothetical protein
MAEKDPRIKRAGVEGFNKPKRTPSHPTKSHVVVAKEGDQIKTIRFGQQGVSGSPRRDSESKADAARRASFKARHAENIAKGKMSGAYWSSVTKWTILVPLLNGVWYMNYATNSGLTNIF